MNFDLLHRRLLSIVRERVRNGEVSESGLARLTGVSQPHMHNVLKGVRMLSTELADKFLQHFDLNAESLITIDVAPALPFQSVPLLSGLLGPSMTEFRSNCFSGSAFVPLSIARTSHLPIAALLEEDFCIAPRFSAADLVVIDQNPEVRTRIAKEGIYVVMTAGGPRLRYVRQGGRRLYLMSDQCIERPSSWESAVLENDSVLEIVRGRVVWISRQFDCSLAKPLRGYFQVSAGQAARI